MIKEKCLITCLLLMAFSGVKSQELQISSVPFPASYDLSAIISMTQDHLGNIWMVITDQGVYKYDGEYFTNYSNERDNPNSLVSNRLECIYADREGIIWVGSFAAGLSRFDPVNEIFTNFQHNEEDPGSIRSNSIRSIVQDNEGGLWIGTLEGLDYLNPETNQFEHTLENSPDEQILNGEHIRVLCIDRAGTLWAGSSGPFYGEETKGGLFRINIRTKEVTRYLHSADTNSLIDNRVTALYEDSKGNFWVGTAGDGLHIMNRDNGTFTRYTYDPQHPDQLSRPPLKAFSYAADHIRFISEDALGYIWIGTFINGINRYHPRNKTVQHFGKDEVGIYKIPSDYLWSFLKTTDDLLWMGVWDPVFNDEALIKINLSPREIDQKVLSKTVYSFEEGEAGSIYMGSNNQLIQIDSTGKETILLQFNQFVSGQFNHLNKDTDGNLWISSETGLYYFNVKTKALESYYVDGQEATTIQIFTSELINNDSLLVGASNGLYLLDLTQKKFTQLNHTVDQIRDQTLNTVRKIFIDSRKNIWVGFHNLGFKKLDLSNLSFIDYSSLENVQDQARDIYEDEFHNLYIGNSRSGIQKYNPDQDKFSLISDNSGLINEESHIWGISKGGDSTLWLTTPSGLVKYDLVTNTAFLFGASWGITAANFTSFGIFKSSYGDYYLGTNTGYLKFRPEDFERRSSFKTKPFISKFTVDDKNVSISNDLEKSPFKFNHDQNNISLTLGYVNFFTRSGDKNLQYKLVNFDDDWRIGKNAEAISYYKLSPDTYTFRYKAMDIYGEWTEDALSFTVMPPWWLTWWAYAAYVLLFMAGVFFVDRFQRRRLLKKAHAEAKEKELAQAREIKKAYNQLKDTQSQLIHSEKMASLGELTAGIAHEIQNPLNFVNNFADVNRELIEELLDEMKKGNVAEAEIIGKDILDNEDKIVHHGKRAEGIVKSMLQHSRTGSGEKELTDINALADDYLRLAYHGFRAKDKSFNADFKTDLDEGLQKISVVPQDIGRVLLNLINNAFQAVKGLESPEVTVKTQMKDGMVEISVRDNGPGIPDDIKDKIFQPFFTTKPTGEGTGLGLSMSYDIVTKGHGGMLKLEPSPTGVAGKVTMGSEFIIYLPFVMNQI